MYIIHVVGGSVFDHTGYYHVPPHFEDHKVTKPKVLKVCLRCLSRKRQPKHVRISTHINGDQSYALEISQSLNVD